MIPGNVIRFVGAALIAVGFVLLVATGAVASMLGVPGGSDAVPGGSDPASMAFWFQLAFMRLFGTTLVGLGVILIWSHAKLSAPQHRSLVRVLAGVLGAVAVMAVGHQIAIWTSTAGWILAGSLALTATACLASAMRPGIEQTA
jgi:hypothetical protein